MEKDKKIFKDMLVEVGNDVTKEIKSMYKNLSPGKNIVDIVRDYDSRHRKDNTILCPAYIEINNILGFYSPIGKYNLRRDDLVSVTLSQQKEIKDGLFAYAKCSVSKSMYKVPSGIDKNDDIINACNIIFYKIYHIRDIGLSRSINFN